MRKLFLLLLVFISLAVLAQEKNVFSNLEEAQAYLQNKPDAVCTLKNLWLSPEKRESFKSAFPQATISFTDTLSQITLSDHLVSFRIDGHTDITKDQIELLIEAYPNIQTIDLYDTRLHRDDMLYLFDTYPDVHFGFTIRFAEHIVRTDATAFSTLHNNSSPQHTSQQIAYLRMCRNLLALDIGHNAVDDLSFLEDMPKLRILIVGRNPLKNTTPIGTLKDLEYLEMFSCWITDISSLVNCTKLIDLNITNNKIQDLSPLLEMPQLERLWINCARTRKEDLELKKMLPELRKALPNCEIDAVSLGTSGNWRFHPRYEIIYDVFNRGAWRAWDDTDNLLPAKNR